MTYGTSALDLWMSLEHAHATTTAELDDELQKAARLPLVWFQVLLRLSRAPNGAMRMQDLAQSLFLSNSGFTRLCDRIEEAGLLRRQSCPSDRRGTFAVITSAGRQRFEKAQPVFARALHDRIGKRFSASQKKALGRALASIGSGSTGAE